MNPSIGNTNTGLRGPFNGLRVIELSSTVAGPFCGRLLADFGAEVVKIELPEGDAVRSMGERDGETSLYAASIFRNKKLVSLDLRTAEAQSIVRELCAKADVLVENFRPGTMERWGLGYDRLSELNPGIVMVRISGYGQSGPYREKPGYGVTCEAISGLRELTGDPDRAPARVGTSMTDYIAGLYAAFGASMALIDRQRSGRGQVVDAALYESAFSFMEPHVPAFATLGVVPTRSGSSLPGHVPNNLYPASDGSYIHITAASQTMFARLATAMEQPELVSHDRFSTAADRVRNQAELDRVISRWCSMRSVAQIEARLADVDVPAARIYNIADIFADPQFRAREMLVEVVEDNLGSVVTTGIVPKLSETPGGIAWAGHRVGQDTHQVLQELLEYSDEYIEHLEAAGVLFRGSVPWSDGEMKSTRSGQG